MSENPAVRSGQPFPRLGIRQDSASRDDEIAALGRLEAWQREVDPVQVRRQGDKLLRPRELPRRARLPPVNGQPRIGRLYVGPEITPVAS